MCRLLQGYGYPVQPGEAVSYPRTCPHCFKAIERQTWEKQIIPAFLALDDANRELVKDSSGYHTPLFEVSYEADSVFRNGYEDCPNLD